MKKRLLAIICGIIAALTLLSGCGGADNKEDKLSLVCSTFPQYDWAMQILGERAEDWEAEILLDSGTDLHNFQPAAEDIITVGDSDVFVYVGGESDDWVDDIFANNKNDAQVVNLMSLLGDRLLAVGHNHHHEETEEEHHHEEEEEGHQHSEACDHEHDEHVWLSLKNAVIFCNEITEAICKADSENAEEYRANNKAYTAKLEELYSRYEEAAKNAAHKELVFADRYPFIYMMHDLGIECHAAFSGCSAETEASFETIIELANKVDELSLDNVIIIDTSDGSIAQTVISNTKTKDQKTIVLDSLQSVTEADIGKGITYLEIMEQNLIALTEAVN